MTCDLAVEDSTDATPELWSRFGRELLAQNQTVEAAKWLQQAYDNGCKDAATMGALGEARLAAKDYPKARQLLEDAMDSLRYVTGVSSLVHFGNRIPAVPDPVIEELKSLNIERMSPIEALYRLKILQEKCGGTDKTTP